MNASSPKEVCSHVTSDSLTNRKRPFLYPPSGSSLPRPRRWRIIRATLWPYTDIRLILPRKRLGVLPGHGPPAPWTPDYLGKNGTACCTVKCVELTHGGVRLGAVHEEKARHGRSQLAFEIASRFRSLHQKEVTEQRVILR